VSPKNGTDGESGVKKVPSYSCSWFYQMLIDVQHSFTVKRSIVFSLARLVDQYCSTRCCLSSSSSSVIVCRGL